ncbi:MAG: hypothetical protein ACI9K2_007394 [Myxococcota bacterium]|jgi:hypothetical protein
MILFALASAALAGGPFLSIGGECPGTIDIDISGITPGAGIAVFVGDGPGSDPIPYGRCAGEVSGLSNPRQLAMMRDLSGTGTYSFSPSVSDGACGAPVQVLDRGSCGLTNVAEVPSEGGDPVLVFSYPVTEGGGSAVYSETVNYFMRVGTLYYDPYGWYGASCGVYGQASLNVDLGTGDVGTYSWSAGDPEFDDFAMCVADGIEHNMEWGWEMGGSGYSSTLESYFFGGAPDLVGVTITEMRLVVDSVNVFPADFTNHDMSGTWEFWGY